MASFVSSYIPTTDSAVIRAADVVSISGTNFGTFNLLQYSEEFDQAAWVPTRCNVVPNIFTSPNGEITADKIVESETSANTHFVQQVLSVVSGSNYTFSVLAKAAERSEALIQLAIGFPTTSFRVDLATGSVLSTGGSPVSTSIEPFPDGWYRISLTQTANLTTSVSQSNIFISVGGTTVYEGDGTSGIYVWGAQLEQSDVATPYVKSNVTWQSRASRATYYDENGVVRTVPANLLLRSKEFDQSPWSKGANTTITPNYAAAPNGTLSAYRLQMVAGVGTFLTQATTLTDGRTYTLSVYARATTGTSQITLAQTGTNIQTFSLTTAWQRLSVTFTASSSTFVGFDNSDIAIDVLIWGAQLEESSTVSEYIPTTTAIASLPRTDAYLPDGNGNFVSAGDVLLEKASTNLLRRSEEFNDAPTWAPTLALISPNVVQAPTGTTTAEKITENGNGIHLVRQNVSISTSTDYVLSVYLKAAERGYASITMFDGTTATEAFFDLLTGAKGGTTSGAISDIQSVGNGWYRCSVKDAKLSGTLSITIRTAITINNNNYIGTSGYGIYVWGAQLEQGTYPTSYIQTTDTERTRAADVSTSSSGFGNSWYSQSEGTVFAHFDTRTWNSDPAFPKVFTFGDDVNNNIWIGSDGTTDNTYRYRVRSGGINYFGPANASRIKTNNNKITIALSSNSALSADGAAPITGSSVTIPNVTKLTIGADEGSYVNIHNNTIRRLTFWPARLPNETLSTITQ